MSVFADPDRLLVGFARTIRERVRPGLSDASADFAARAAIEMALHLVHRNRSPVPPPDRAAAEAMAVEIAALTRAAPNDAGSARLMALLHADSRFYRDDDAAYRGLLDEEAALAGRSFDPPSDVELTQILRTWTGDPAIEGRLSGRAIGGYSKQTLFVDLISGGGEVCRRLVMRRDLPFAEGDRSSVTDEYPVIAALYARGLPVAAPLFVEADATVLQTAFLMSERVAGRLYGNSLGLTETPDFDPEDLFGTLLADLHAIDPAAVALPTFAARSDGEAAQVDRIEGFIAIYRKAVAIPAAALEIGLAWLRANAHLVAGRQAIVHGDIGYHNLLIHEGRPSALVDWEMAHVGSPAEDLAYVSSYIGDADRLIERYVAHGGWRPPVAAMTYARVFGDVRNAIYGAVAMAQFNAGVLDDVSTLPIVLSSYAAYVAKLEATLSQTIAAHGFRWEG